MSTIEEKLGGRMGRKLGILFAVIIFLVVIGLGTAAAMGAFNNNNNNNNNNNSGSGNDSNSGGSPPQNRYIQSGKCQEYANNSNYIVCPGLDSWGGDIEWLGGEETVAQVLAECSNLTNCKGATKQGWLKHTIAEPVDLTDGDHVDLYIRKDAI